MSKIKIGAQVTAKVRPTNVTVSGTFQGYRLEDQEDPTSVCGKVFYVKDGMQHLDYVYVDSIKVCKGEDEDEKIRKILIHIVKGACDKYGIKYKGDEITEEKLLAYLEKQKEQKSAEWSEEDERTLESFLGWLQGSMGEKTYSSWLKSLPERFSLKPKQEWSEEDETHLGWIIECFDSWKYQVPEFADQYQSAINFLKSLRPQPHWKPSEEQMWALDVALENFYNQNDRAALESLRTDLQKLLSL